MTLIEAVARLAGALRKAVEAHDRPNSFGCSELREFGGPPVALAGRIAASSALRNRLHELLGGYAVWGHALVYVDRRWHV